MLRARVPATGTVIKSAEGGQAGGNFDGAGGQGKGGGDVVKVQMQKEREVQVM